METKNVNQQQSSQDSSKKDKNRLDPKSDPSARIYNAGEINRAENEGLKPKEGGSQLNPDESKSSGSDLKTSGNRDSNQTSGRNQGEGSGWNENEKTRGKEKLQVGRDGVNKSSTKSDQQNKHGYQVEDEEEKV